MSGAVVADEWDTGDLPLDPRTGPVRSLPMNHAIRLKRSDLGGSIRQVGLDQIRREVLLVFAVEVLLGRHHPTDRSHESTIVRLLRRGSHLRERIQKSGVLGEFVTGGGAAASSSCARAQVSCA